VRSENLQWRPNIKRASVCYTVHVQKNDAVSRVIKKFISHPTRAQHTLSAAGTVQVSLALPAVRFSCLLQGRGTSLQDVVAAGERFLELLIFRNLLPVPQDAKVLFPTTTTSLHCRNSQFICVGHCCGLFCSPGVCIGVSYAVHLKPCLRIQRRLVG
jgi:hypothetical protein